MWTKIQSQAEVNKLKMNSRLLKFTGSGTPVDPPLHDPTYTLFVIQQNTSGNLNLKTSGQNPLFSASFAQTNTGGLPKSAAEMIEEGNWWF